MSKQDIYDKTILTRYIMALIHVRLLLRKICGTNQLMKLKSITQLGKRTKAAKLLHVSKNGSTEQVITLKEE